MKFFDVRHPFLRPLWRRIALVAATLGWSVVELMGGNVFWAILFGSVGAFLAWEFFIVYDPKNYEEKDKP
jgi:hypothetical protein